MPADGSELDVKSFGIHEYLATERSRKLSAIVPSNFVSIRDLAARSVALFTEMGKVIQSPRCLNCHPLRDRPTQYNTLTPDQPAVLRGPEGKGVAGIECTTGHGPANVDFVNCTGSIPGNPNWHLAPIEMA